MIPLEPTLSKIPNQMKRPPRATRLCAEHGAFQEWKSAGDAYVLRSPSTATTPKEKTLLAFLMWRLWISFEKERAFFFGVPSYRSCPLIGSFDYKSPQ